MSGKRFLLISSFCVLICSQAAGDTVHRVRGGSVRNVRITGFDEGKLEFIERGKGQRHSVDYDDVAMIRVDGRVALNKSETYLQLDQHNAAIDEYKAALRKARRGWEKTWVRVRLVNLLLRLGRADQAVEIFLPLAEEHAGWVMRLVPSKSQISGSQKVRRKGAAMLIKAKEVSDKAQVRAVLDAFVERLGCGGGDELSSDKGKEKNAGRVTLKRPGSWLDKWARKRISKGRYEQVSQMTEKLFEDAVRADLAGIIYWRGRARLGMEEYDPAALDLLRVAIEFPAVRYAPLGLYYASRALSKGARPDYARKVRRELIDKYADVSDIVISDLVDRARDELEDSQQR